MWKRSVLTTFNFFGVNCLSLLFFCLSLLFLLVSPFFSHLSPLLWFSSFEQTAGTLLFFTGSSVLGTIFSSSPLFLIGEKKEKERKEKEQEERKERNRRVRMCVTHQTYYFCQFICSVSWIKITHNRQERGREVNWWEREERKREGERRRGELMRERERVVRLDLTLSQTCRVPRPWQSPLALLSLSLSLPFFTLLSFSPFLYTFSPPSFIPLFASHFISSLFSLSLSFLFSLLPDASDFSSQVVQVV